MKKLLTTSAILLTATVLVACSNNQSATKDSSKQPKTEQTKANDKSASKKATSLDDFKKSDIDTTFKEESTNSLPDTPDLLTQQITDKVVQINPR